MRGVDRNNLWERFIWGILCLFSLVQLIVEIMAEVGFRTYSIRIGANDRAQDALTLRSSTFIYYPWLSLLLFIPMLASSLTRKTAVLSIRPVDGSAVVTWSDRTHFGHQTVIMAGRLKVLSPVPDIQSQRLTSLRQKQNLTSSLFVLGALSLGCFLSFFCHFVNNEVAAVIPTAARR